MRTLTYLTFDSLQEGVGASQVLEYILKISSSGRKVIIVSFEKSPPSVKVHEKLIENKITWVPLPFGRYGIFGGIYRVLRMTRRIERNSVVHARGNLAALAVLITGNRRWIWDCRSMHADQRRALSRARMRNLIYLVMLFLEFILARRSARIIVITSAVVPIFQKRYKVNVKKIDIISTCVNLEKFKIRAMPERDVIQVLLSGTFSSAYDLDIINRIIREIRLRSNTCVTVAASLGATDSWKLVDYDRYVSVTHDEMPNLIAESHIGFSIWKNDLGVCLKSVASTKTAEFLATGRPVFINSEQGDFRSLFDKYNIGVITEFGDDESVGIYADQMLSQLSNSDIPLRCRSLAQDYFSLNRGVERLIEVYSEFDLRE